MDDACAGRIKEQLHLLSALVGDVGLVAVASAGPLDLGHGVARLGNLGLSVGLGHPLVLWGSCAGASIAGGKRWAGGEPSK